MRNRENYRDNSSHLNPKDLNLNVFFYLRRSREGVGEKMLRNFLAAVSMFSYGIGPVFPPQPLFQEEGTHVLLPILNSWKRIRIAQSRGAGRGFSVGFTWGRATPPGRTSIEQARELDCAPALYCALHSGTLSREGPSSGLTAISAGKHRPSLLPFPLLSQYRVNHYTTRHPCPRSAAGNRS